MLHQLMFALFTVTYLVSNTFAQQRVSDEFAEALQAKLDSCVNHYDVPGISATVLLPGDRFWNGVSGEADIHTHVGLDTAYLFQEASVTKLFTATLILQLLEEGLLTLDDTVGQHLAVVEHVPSNIRIRHLLKHRSGLADFMAAPGAANSWLIQPNHTWTPLETIETFGDDPEFAQGAAFSYCNTNYVLLGKIAEVVTGVTLAEAFRERFFVPIGMEQTVLRPADALPGQLVPGWSSLSSPNTYTDDMTFFLGTAFSSMVAGAGALVSVPWDVARFDRALFTGELLSSAMLDTMRTCTDVNMGSNVNGYGYGSMRYSFGGRTYYGHGGDINGFTQLVIHNVEDSVTLALSINRNNAPRGPIAAALLGVAFQQLVVGLEPGVSGSFDISLSPNPVRDQLRVSSSWVSGPITIRVVDAHGRVVHEALSMGGSDHTVDVSLLTAGMYHGLFTTIDGRQVQHSFILE